MMGLNNPVQNGGLKMIQTEQQKQNQELRQAFDSGRDSGLQLRHDNQGPLSTRDLAHVLSRSALPCVGGTWQEQEPDVWILQRPPCQRESAHMCAVWRESVDGLVMGAGEEARYSRHSHFEDPDELCVDVLYTIDKPHWRWASLPQKYHFMMQELQADLATHQAELTILGYAEGQIFYTLKDSHPALAGHRHGFLSESLQHKAKAFHAEVRLIEMSPRAVWNGD